MSFKGSVDFLLDWVECAMKLRPTGLSCLLGHIETFMRRFKVAPSMGSHLNSGPAPLLGAASYRMGLLPGQSAARAQSGQCSRETQTHERYVGTESSTLSRTIWILPEEERNLHTLVSAFGIHYCSPNVWFDLQNEMTDGCMYSQHTIPNNIKDFLFLVNYENTCLFCRATYGR